MNVSRKDISAVGKTKNKQSARKDKDYRKLQQELTREKEKYDQLASKQHKELQEVQQQVMEESQARFKLQMEVNCPPSHCPNHSLANMRQKEMEEKISSSIQALLGLNLCKFRTQCYISIFSMLAFDLL